MDKKIYIKPSSIVNLVCMESLLAGSFESKDGMPTADNDNNQFSKTHRPGSLWNSTWEDEDDDDVN